MSSSCSNGRIDSAPRIMEAIGPGETVPVLHNIGENLRMAANELPAEGVAANYILMAKADLDLLRSRVRTIEREDDRGNPSPTVGTRLYVIKQFDRDYYWTCSSQHGTGWHDGHPKQSFSPSELTREIRRLIDEKWFVPLKIIELTIP